MTLDVSLKNIPQPVKRRLAVHIKPAAERALRDGHPWLFEDGITSLSYDGAPPGTLAVVFDAKDRFLAVGLYDPQSPIRVRVLQHHIQATINRAWFEATLQKAVARRQPLPGAGTTGYRLVYGENDGLPGFIVDRYASVLVVKIYSSAWFPHLPVVLPALLAAQPAETIVLRFSRHVATGDTFGLTDGDVIYGALPDAQVQFVENGLRFQADVVSGHKTGFFFDQRENRTRVRGLAAGASVLDVFAYSGGFSVYAAAGGARRVLSIDQSKPALAATHQNFMLNSDLPAIAATDHETLVADAFEAMATLRESGERFGLVIVDPPAFAKRQSEVDGALQAYASLAELATALVKPGGHLVMASCSSRIRDDAFFQAVQAAAGQPLKKVQTTGHALDHPVNFPEGKYLKCLFAEIG